jgi:hypothetical protein
LIPNSQPLGVWRITLPTCCLCTQSQQALSVRCVISSVFLLQASELLLSAKTVENPEEREAKLREALQVSFLNFGMSSKS